MLWILTIRSDYIAQELLRIQHISACVHVCFLIKHKTTNTDNEPDSLLCTVRLLPTKRKNEIKKLPDDSYLLPHHRYYYRASYVDICVLIYPKSIHLYHAYPRHLQFGMKMYRHPTKNLPENFGARDKHCNQKRHMNILIKLFLFSFW